MEMTFEQNRKFFEARHPGQHVQAREKVTVRCAFHDDRTPSCTLFLAGRGGFNCHGCGAKGGLLQFEIQFSQCTIEQARINISKITGAALDNSERQYVATYYYLGPDRIPVSKKDRFRYAATGKKDFDQKRYDSTGRWQNGLAADTPRLLYNHPDVVCANLLLWFEGEKDCDTAAALVPKLWPERTDLHIACTTNIEGAWAPGVKAKWREEYNKSFAHKTVVVFEDNDPSGEALADHVSEQAFPFAESIRRIAFPGMRAGYDFTDWVDEHRDNPEQMMADLRRMIESAPLWKPADQDERANCLVEAVEWANTASPAVDWLVDGVIQSGANGIIAAEPKTGKSLVALDLLISLGCGQRWLGREVKRRIRCAYISREDSPLLTKARIAGFLRGKGIFIDGGMAVDPTGWIWCNTREQLETFNIGNDDHLRDMAHDLKEHGVEFTVIDVFNRIHSRNENDNSEMTQVVERISQMGREAGCALGVVHHVSKENGSSGRFFTRIRGASSIHGWTEWSIGLTLENPNNEGKKLIRKAEFESKAGESAPLSFTVEFGGGNLCLQLVDPMAYSTGNTGAPYRRQ